VRKVIQPKKMLKTFRIDGVQPPLNVEDVLLIEEIGSEMALRHGTCEQMFYNCLKEMVSAYNQEAELSGNLPVDFDDLHTKYSEYLAVLQTFLTER